MEFAVAIAASESESWEVRAQAAARICAAYRPDLLAVVRKLLIHDPDTAVVEAAAQALVANGAYESLRVLLEAVAGAGDDEQLNQAYFGAMFPVVPVPADLPIHRLLVQALSDDDPNVQEGARVALAWESEES